jgi:catechol 2,3-dioxygenase-like lactoylglutathione lyase family enzyme
MGEVTLASKMQHIALHVADVERSAAFYEAVFGGKARTRPVLRSGPFVEQLLGGLDGIEQRGVHISLPQGGIVLVVVWRRGTAQEPEERPFWQRRILHFCIQVDDVRATAEKVEAAGGRLLFPVNEQTGRPFVFIEDPDGHVVEMIDMTFDEAVDSVHRFVPGSRPE